ncbi:MAG: hypothetical protein ACR2QM_08340 [Longimicrobiales bacterium]
MFLDRWTVPMALTAIAGVVCGCSSEVGDQSTVMAIPIDAIDVLSTLENVTRVVDVQPTEDEHVWVLNSQPPYFAVVGPDGEIQREFGEQGGGPQEFDHPVSLVGVPGSTDMWVYDWARNALIEISPDSRRTLRLPKDTIPVPSLVSFKGAGINPAPPWLESAGDGFLFARARTPRSETALHLWSADVLRISGDETALVGLEAPLADLLGEPQAVYGGATVLMPYPLWSTCRDGALGLYDPLGGVLRRFAPATGEEMTPVPLPEPTPVEMTPDLVFEMFYRQFAEDRPGNQGPGMEQMRELTREQNREFVQNSNESFPEYSELRCDTRGEFWLRRFDPTRGRLGLGPDWLHISVDGTHSLVSLPPSFRVFRIEQDRMWGTLRDELGVESVALLELTPLR